MFIDSYYILLVVPALILSMIAQMAVKSAYNKYSRVRASRGITASDVTRRMLTDAGISQVGVARVAGTLSDHYDPRENIIRLSDGVHDSSSIAAIGVAAHEAGHAMQYAEGYAPIRVRNALVPVVNFGSSISIPLILIGAFIGVAPFVQIGILLFAGVALFQLITLPVEFDASARAIRILREGYFLDEDELQGAKTVLRAAAMTYVAALVLSLAQLLRLVAVFGGSRRRD